MEKEFEMQNNLPEGNEPIGEKAFTQEDVNRIISKRLSEEKSKSEAALIEREEKLKQREFDIRARELLADKGLPANFVSILRGVDEETFISNIEAVESYINSKVEEKTPKIETRIVGTGFERGAGLAQNRFTLNNQVRESMGLE